MNLKKLIKDRDGSVMRRVSRDRVKNDLFDAPVGTIYEIENNEGDYVGEYTRESDRWVGTQRYGSRYKKPTDVSTPDGLATNLMGMTLRRKAVKL